MATPRPESTSTGHFLTAPNTPLPNESLGLDPPRASYIVSDASTPRDSYANSSPNNSSPLLPPNDKVETDGFEQPGLASVPQRKKRSPRLLWIAGLAALVILVLVVVLPVVFTVVKHPKHHSASSSSNPAGSGPIGSGNGNPNSPTGATSGGNGSVIITDDGSQFTYINNFGGYWVSDPADPFNNDARPNSWTPPLNTSWVWGQDQVFGVNLGGWFVLEPFITPALFQKYPGAVDEWTLSTLMAADTASGGLNQLEDHYNTFITEQDFAEIAGAGLNWIRVPIPYWAIDVWPGEPFLAKTSWKYILKMLGWARKYGLRVNLDLHTCPGSQNGYNHSGKLGQVDFLNGVMGIANAQRMLNYIRIITEFISQPEYQPVVPIWGIINEALLETIGQDQLTSFYLEAHDMIRNITGYGGNNGAYISIHDGFQGMANWAGFLQGSDRIILDTHPYFAFDGLPNDAPIATGTGLNAGGTWPLNACNSWGPAYNQSQVQFGVTIAGEFSNGYNDCGLFLTGVGPEGEVSSTGECAFWIDSSTWNQTVIDGVLEFGMASMDALQNWFFWTWKIGNSSTTGTVQSPLWSYQAGLQGGWVPTDPRSATGTCAALGVSGPVFNGEYQSWQTGGAGAGTIAPLSVAEFGQWPPLTLSGLLPQYLGEANLLPTYAFTGAIETLPIPTLTSAAKTVSEGDGWYDAQDTQSAPTSIVGCAYLDPWDAISSPVPPLCGTGGVSAGGAVPVVPTVPLTTPVLTGPALTTATTTALTTALTTAPATTTLPVPVRRYARPHQR